MNKHAYRRRTYWIYALLAIAGIMVIGACLRFPGLTANGFRNCDEGYYFHPALVMKIVNDPTPILYYYHGTVLWVFQGCSLLGFKPESALIWAALNGLAAILLLFLFCRSIYPLKTAILVALAMSCNYYLVYYSRINLSNIYGLFFALAVMCPLARFILQWSRPLADVRAGGPSPWHRKMFLSASVAGLIAGLLFHVRIDFFVFLYGMWGAALLATGLRTERRHWLTQILRLTAYGGTFTLAAAVSYAIFVATYYPWFRWSSTYVWYLKQLPFLSGTARPWGLYLYEHLWRLSSVPFWAVALLGASVEAARFRRLSFPRLWLLLCFLGSVFGFTVIALPFPRGHIFAVVLMTIYWALGIRHIATAFPRWRYIVPPALVLLTMAGEFRLIQPMFYKRARYDKVARIIQAESANFIHNRNWPVMRSYLPMQTQTIFEFALKTTDDQDALKMVMFEGPFHDDRFLLLDYYTAPFMDTKMLTRMAVTCPPAAVFFNDYGDDYHNCMDSFGRWPKHNLFSDKLVLYDLKNIHHPIPEFPPYTTEEDMENRFLTMLVERMNQANAEPAPAAQPPSM